MSFVTIGTASHIGLRKEENQDFFAYNAPEDGTVPKEGILLALADGMGGRPGGATASRIAIDVIIEEYYKNIESNSILKSLNKAFLKANEQVMAKGDEDRSFQGMGTTLVVVVLKRNKIYYANIGDSRGYLIHNNEISQFTKDHSVVADLVRAGYITEDQAPTYPGGNIITKAIGIDAELKVDTAKNVKKTRDGQYILLCCDGLYREVPDEEVLKIVKEYQEPDLICDKLIEKANEHGGDDNITVMIAKIDKTNRLSDLAGRVINLVR
ncbi:MAG: Stp1/IreP family PP2C-type Ser/Thr phosphatase [Deltaproteobacteria bacterium]|nr:Stp1/IreP family PP2C-type Ser/Thr phosphatase [Deltaproteobacteria bacterium]